MIATLAACGFACTTLIALVGWWHATDRIVILDAMLDALETETWSEEAQ